jgi:hypothetical protein
MDMGNIFSSFYRYGEGFVCGSVSIWGRRRTAGEDDCIGVAKGGMPMAIEEQSLGEGAG